MPERFKLFAQSGKPNRRRPHIAAVPRRPEIERHFNNVNIHGHSIMRNGALEQPAKHKAKTAQTVKSSFFNDVADNRVVA